MAVYGVRGGPIRVAGPLRDVPGPISATATSRDVPGPSGRMGWGVLGGIDMRDGPGAPGELRDENGSRIGGKIGLRPLPVPH